MRKVFLYEMKKMIAPYAIFLGIMTIILFSIMFSTNAVSNGEFVAMMSAFMLALMLGTLFYSFSYNKKRVSADMHYSLPVTKRQLFFGKYLASVTGLIGLSIIFLGINFMVFGIAAGIDKINLNYTPLSEQAYKLFISSLMRLILCIPLFNFSLLLFYKANSIIDGIVYVALGNAIVYIAMEILSLFIVEYPFLTTFPVFMFTHGIDQLMYNTENNTFYVVLYTLYAIIGYGLIGYLLWWVKKDSAIRTQEISDGIFGYKVFLPAVGLLIMLETFVRSKIFIGWGSSGGILFLIQFILISVGLFIGYCVYHRSLKFSKTSYITFGVVTMINLILMLVI